MNDDLERRVNEKVCVDQHFTIYTLSLGFLKFHGLHYMKLSLIIWIQKVFTRWVPKILTEEHKNKHVASALTFLTHYWEEEDEMFSYIVTGDETWASHIMSVWKQQSLRWKQHTASPTWQKFKQTISTRKIMCIVFWDSHNNLLVQFMPRGTINNAVYCDETLKKPWHS